MSDKIGTSQHFVPRALMKSFGLTDTRKTNIVAYSKSKEREMPAKGISGYCAQDGFYDLSDGKSTVDAEFDRFETSFGRTVKSIKEGNFRNLSTEALIDLVIFVAQIYLRNQSRLISHNKIGDILVQASAPLMGIDPKWIVHSDRHKNKSKDGYLESLRGCSFTSHPMTDHFVRRMPHLYQAHPDRQFIIGDDPVQIRRGSTSVRPGLKDPENYIFMPLTPMHAVVLIDPDSETQRSLPEQGKILVMQLDLDWIDEYNKDEIYQAQELIFYTPSSRDDFNRLITGDPSIKKAHGHGVMSSLDADYNTYSRNGDQEIKRVITKQASKSQLKRKAIRKAQRSARKRGR